MQLDFSPGQAPVLSVSQLLRSARDLLERRFPLQWISGEVSNLRPAASGHFYFTLKDEAAQVDCVMFKVCNRVSWLNALSKVMNVPLEHEDAPVLVKYSSAEFKGLLAPFAEVRIVPERFPVKSRLHGGWKGLAFNTFFVGTFNALPRAWVRPLGWHLMAFCRKA